MELFLYLIFLDLDKMDIYRDNSPFSEWVPAIDKEPTPQRGSHSSKKTRK